MSISSALMYLYCMVVWGLNFIAIKIQGTYIPLEMSLFYRLAIAAIFFIGLVKFFGPVEKPYRGDWLYLIAFGVLNLALSYLLLYYATTWIETTLVMLVFSLKTTSTPIAMRWYLGQPLNLTVLAGGTLGLVGVLCVLYPEVHQRIDLATIKGLAFAVGGTLLTSLSDVASARNSQHGVHPLYANAFGLSTAAAMMFLICKFHGYSFEIALTRQYLGAVLYLALASSCIAWLFYLELIQRIGESASKYMVALFPLIGGFGSVMIDESEPTKYLIVGCLLSCIGAAVALGGRSSRFNSAVRSISHCF